MSLVGRLLTMRTGLGFARRRTTWDLLHRSGLLAIVGRRYGGVGSIFGFHRVAPDAAARPDREMYVTPRFLEAWLTSLADAGVETISIGAALERLRDPGEGPPARRFAVVAFDDGYADNVEYALPVLERFGAPFVVYVSTDAVEGGEGLWWLGLARLIRRDDAIEAPPMGRRFAASSLREKARAYAEVERWVWEDIARRAPLLREVLARRGVSLAEEARKAGLSRERLRALGDHPLATVGGHAVTHPDLTSLSERDARREMSDNKTFLEEVCGRPVEHFAYPYGACGEREAALAGEAGFESAVTNGSGCLFPEHGDSPMLLPRCMVGGARMWLSFMHAQRHGAQRFVESRGGRPAAGV